MDTPPVMYPQSQNRRAPKPRTPLQERSQSQTNEESSRLGRESRRAPFDAEIFSATPFPTKPQHVLLPSTIRKQRSFRDTENQLPGILEHNYQHVTNPPGSSGNESLLDESRARMEPVVQLKRSVTTLRDMYEAQAERSRPSTATSYLPRPGTANSRLRSVSSSEGLSGRNAWEELNKVSADDMALLPTLSRASIEKIGYSSSFASRAGHQNYLTSTPNYRTYGTSSPQGNSFRDELTSESERYRQSSSSGAAQTSSSSPNFVRLGRSSSISETLNTERSASSPNFVKLGTSSPGLRTSSSPTPSEASRKRKRSEAEVESSFIATNRTYTSSPPYAVIAASSSDASLRSPEMIMPSSPPHPHSSHSQSVGASSPVFRLPGPVRNVSGSSSSSSAHANLQAALSSSPMPPIQYPVIRAPTAVASNLSVPKRVTRHSSIESSGHWISRLSPVPSEWDESLSRNGSKRSRRMTDYSDEPVRPDSATPEPTGNESQVRIIPIQEDDHEHEAVDELRALPKKRVPLAYRSPPAVPVRTNSLFGTQSSSSDSQSQSRLNSLRTSLDTRLNSMRSFTHSRQNSFMSGSARPGSASSQSTSIVVPTWARRYYSGFYRDSFQYLYPSQSNSAAQMPIPLHHQFDRTTSMTSSALHPGASVAPSNQSRRSWASIRNSLRSSMMEFVPSVLMPKPRPQLGARKSHMSPGIGPLVSNPVHPDPLSNRTDAHRESYGIRRVSEQLPAADPRAHWAGITEEQQNMMQYQDSTPYHSSREVNRQSADSQSVYFDAPSGQMMARSRFIDVPHLHHDRRLNTGSSKSRGFGFPFNQKGRHQAPSIYETTNRVQWFPTDLRDAQVTCFILGFIFPFSWFIGAFLPLPRRPESFGDIEKAMHEQHNQQAGDWGDLDIVAKLRLERHIRGIEELKWQNARWWKRMNRWMCLVGVVVFVLAIILAVIGTRNHW